jgi:hypothetical protein
MRAAAELKVATHVRAPGSSFSTRSASSRAALLVG